MLQRHHPFARTLLQAAQEVVSNVVDSMQGGDAYRYTFEVQTSCNDGAATDGGVDVKITDYKCGCSPVTYPA